MRACAASSPELNKALAELAAKELGLETGFGSCHVTAVVDEDNGDKLAALVVYSRFSGRDMEMSIVSWHPKWCSAKVLRILFHYPFEFAKCARVTATTRERATNVRRFLERIGFRQEGVVRKCYVDNDGVFYGMLREECKWLRKREDLTHGQGNC